MKRVVHMEKYEKQQGHHYTWGPNEVRIERSEKTTRDREEAEEEQMEDFICTYPDCVKVCKTKGGLRIHQVRMHEKQRKTFTCSKCNATFASESSWKNHGKRCMEERAEDPSRARCGTCGKDVSKNNIARHRRICKARAGIAGRIEEARETRGGQDAAQAPTLLHHECTEQRGGSAPTVEGCWRRPTWPGTNELVEDGSRGGPFSVRSEAPILDWIWLRT